MASSGTNILLRMIVDETRILLTVPSFRMKLQNTKRKRDPKESHPKCFHNGIILIGIPNHKSTGGRLKRFFCLCYGSPTFGYCPCNLFVGCYQCVKDKNSESNSQPKEMLGAEAGISLEYRTLCNQGSVKFPTLNYIKHCYSCE